MSRHLLHIGYPKAGSTFLQAWFERHPELHYAPGGLGGFYNVYEMARPITTSCKYYVTSFEGLTMPHKSAGDIRLDLGGAESQSRDNTRENQARVCALLKSLYPGSLVLIVTRGFRGMVLSAYSQSVRMGSRLHLDGMCRELADRLQDDAEHYFDYDYLIGLYREAFGTGNVIVLPYELLRDDQQEFLSTIEQRLGLSHVDVELGRVNPSLSAEELYWYPVISHNVSALGSRLGQNNFKRLYRWYVTKTLNNRLRFVIKVLSFLRPNRRITDADFPLEILTHLERKAETLKGNPLFTRYAKDYLWREEELPQEDHSDVFTKSSFEIAAKV